MKIALVGKNEKLQGVLAAECVKRGMTVTQGLPSAEDLKTVDAVVDAGKGLSAEVIKENPGIRFLVVGGEAAGENVTVFNPPEQFLPNGEKCGAYVPSTGFEVVNSVGEKAISYADAAIALADELEKKHFAGKSFTAVSDTSLLQTQKAYNMVDISFGSGTMFKTKGAYFGIFTDFSGPKRSSLAYQAGKVMIVSRRSMPRQ